MKHYNSANITGYNFSTLTLEKTINLLAAWSAEEQKRSRYFACVNPHSLEQARKDHHFSEAIQNADLVTPDGTGIVLASRMLNKGIPERVCGPDIFPLLCEYLNRRNFGTRMFFLGSYEDNLRLLSEKFSKIYPNLECVGTYAPPYKPEFKREDNERMIGRINQSGADVLWIGLGAPKQEKWAYQQRDQLKVKLIGPIGGVFDFFTGRVKLPPMWAQKFGLISLYRLSQEPRRLWRRNLDSPIFLMRVLVQLLKGDRR